MHSPIKIKAVALVLMTILTTGLLGGDASAQSLEAHRETLDNGMVVLVKEMPSSPVVAFNALIRDGSATEGRYLGTGISHFVEHMLFKGTETRGVGEIAEDVKSLGGIINASTGFDRTSYIIEAPADQFRPALDVLADMLMNAAFDPEEVRKEREVILSELRLYYDNPDRRLSDLVFESVYTRHPYKHPIIGYPPLFRSLDRQDLVDFYRERYVPNNIVLAVAGNVDKEEVLSAVTEKFRDFQPVPYRTRNLPEEPPQTGRRELREGFPADLARLSLVYQGVAVSDPDMVPLDILSAILGHGESSRLHLDIVKGRELAYSVSTMNYTPIDKGLFEISCLLEEGQVRPARKAIREQVERIKRKGVLPGELDKAKNQLTSRFVFGRQKAGSVAYEMAVSEAFTGDHDFNSGYIEAVRRVEPADIRRVARRYLNDTALNVIELLPKEKPRDVMEEEKTAPESAVEKHVLDNGLTVLLRADDNFPLVALGVVLQGGVHQENPGMNGVSRLLANLWTKGSRTRTADEIAREVESRGASLDAFSGRNSAGLTYKSLAKNLAFGIGLVEELIESPALPEDEFRKEKNRTESAIRERDNDIYDATVKAMKENLYTRSPLRFTALGTLQSVRSLTRQDVVDYYESLNSPDNMVLYVFGDIDEDEVLVSVKKRFGDLKPKPVDLRKEVDEDLIREQKTIERTMEKEQALVAVGFQGPSMKSPDRYGMTVAANLLGAPLNGRIFVRIRDEMGEAYSLGGYYVPGLDRGFVYFYVGTTRESVPAVREALLDIIGELGRGEVTGQELESTKTYLAGTHAMSLETNAGLALTSALDELYGLGHDHFRRYEEKIDGVSAREILHLARTYLDPRRAVVVITYPEEASGVAETGR